MSDGAVVPGSEESRFIEKAVKELAGPDGRMIPVRLVLFAEMLRTRDWKAKTLRELGGMEGIGETFLEESLSARDGAVAPSSAPARRRPFCRRCCRRPGSTSAIDASRSGCFAKLRAMPTGPPISTSSCTYSTMS